MKVCLVVGAGRREDLMSKVVTRDYSRLPMVGEKLFLEEYKWATLCPVHDVFWTSPPSILIRGEDAPPHATLRELGFTKWETREDIVARRLFESTEDGEPDAKGG